MKNKVFVVKKLNDNLRYLPLSLPYWDSPRTKISKQMIGLGSEECSFVPPLGQKLIRAGVVKLPKKKSKNQTKNQS